MMFRPTEGDLLGHAVAEQLQLLDLAASSADRVGDAVLLPEPDRPFRLGVLEGERQTRADQFRPRHPRHSQP